MQDRRIAATLLVVLWVMLMAPATAAAVPPDTGLEPLVSEWRMGLGMQPLQADERLYAAAGEVAGDGTYCPQDRLFIEFMIGGAMYRSGYDDRRGYGLVLCGEYPEPDDVIHWIEQHGGPRHPDLKDVGVVHLASLDFVRRNGNHVTDVWVLLAAAPRE